MGRCADEADDTKNVLGRWCCDFSLGQAREWGGIARAPPTAAIHFWNSTGKSSDLAPRPTSPIKGANRVRT